MSTTFETAIVLVPLSPASLDKLRSTFSSVHYYPEGNAPNALFEQAEAWLTPYYALPEGVSIDAVPQTTLCQLTAAGANYAMAQPLFDEPKARTQLALCTASGIHAFTIPQYVISQIVNLYMFHHIQFDMMRTKAVWPAKADLVKAAYCGATDKGVALGSRSLYGKTAGLLGYGHIAREVARLLKAFNVNVIVANSDGKKKPDIGYILPGTGDEEGTIPSAYYSTFEDDSFKQFLSQTDILISSLPSTKATRYFLTAEHLKSMKPGAVFVNVGRGDLIRSEDLLEGLEDPSGISAAAIDVTDPEPLTPGHPLFTHPRVIVTPHACGDMEGYNDKACDLFISNVEGIRAGNPPMNQVQFDRGY